MLTSSCTRGAGSISPDNLMGILPWKSDAYRTYTWSTPAVAQQINAANPPTAYFSDNKPEATAAA